MKKILTMLFLTIFSLNILTVNAEYLYSDVNLTTKNLILTKGELEDYPKGESYMKALDTFIEEASIEKLEEINERVDAFLSKTDIKSGETLLVIKYLNYKLDLELITRESEEDDYNDEDSELDSDGEEDVLETPVNEEDIIEELTDLEKQKVEVEVLKLQKDLLSGKKELITSIFNELEDNLNVEQKGDMSLDLDLDFDRIGNIDYSFSLEDYITKTNSSFESSFEGDIKSDLTYDFNNAGKGVLDFVTDFEQILKEGDYYYLLNNFHVSDKEGMEDIEELLDILENIGEKGSYIKIPADNEVQELYKYLANMNLNTINSTIGELEKNPMFETYGKSGDKYLLVPTKYACNKYKELANVFDPFNGSVCSDSQYQDLVEKTKELGELYMSFEGTNTKIGFNYEDEYGSSIDFYMTYDSNKIQEISFYTGSGDSGEHVSFKYLNGESLNMEVVIDEMTMNFDGILSSENKFTDIVFDYIFEDSNISLVLKDNKITGNINVINKGYSYVDEKWQKTETSKILGDITGSTKGDNSLENLSITYRGIDLQNNNEEFFNGETMFKDKYFSISLDTNEEGFKSEFLITSTFDEDNLPENGEFMFAVYTKDGTYDSDTYEYIYSGDFKKVFSSNIKIKDREVSGETLIPDYLTITHDGWIGSERFNLDNSIKVESKLLEELNSMGSLTDYNAKVEDLEKIKSLYGVFNISGEYANSNKNTTITSFFDVSGKEAFRFEFKNESTINYKDRDDIFIETPDDYVDIEDLNY